MLSISRCRGQSWPWFTFRVLCRPDRVLKSGTAKCPVQADESRKALDESRWLAERHPEQRLHRQAGLDGSAAAVALSATLDGGRGFPSYGRVEPDRQRAPAIERRVVGGPIPGLVGRGCWCTHADQLPRWINEMNPSWDLCNRALGIPSLLSGSTDREPRNLERKPVQSTVALIDALCDPKDISNPLCVVAPRRPHRYFGLGGR